MPQYSPVVKVVSFIRLREVTSKFSIATRVSQKIKSQLKSDVTDLFTFVEVGTLVLERWAPLRPGTGEMCLFLANSIGTFSMNFVSTS